MKCCVVKYGAFLENGDGRVFARDLATLPGFQRSRTILKSHLTELKIHIRFAVFPSGVGQIIFCVHQINS
jgi:hypothetical protein